MRILNVCSGRHLVQRRSESGGPRGPSGGGREPSRRADRAPISSRATVGDRERMGGARCGPAARGARRRRDRIGRGGRRSRWARARVVVGAERGERGRAGDRDRHARLDASPRMGRAAGRASADLGGGAPGTARRVDRARSRAALGGLRPRRRARSPGASAARGERTRAAARAHAPNAGGLGRPRAREGRRSVARRGRACVVEHPGRRVDREPRGSRARGPLDRRALHGCGGNRHLRGTT